MYKIGIIGERDSVLGFMALGFAVMEAEKAEDAVSLLRGAVKSGEYAVIFITESLCCQIEDETAKYKDMPLPAVVSLPGKDGSLGYGMENIRNAAIRAVARLALYKGIEVMGIYNGYQGLIEDNVKPLHERDVSFIINRGGTMLYSARSNDFRTKEGRAKAVENCRKHGIDGIVTIGGDGTFRGATDLALHGIPTIGVTGTIDNDITATDYTVGFDTAMNTVVDLVDKLRDTSESHSRCTVVEVMGREAGDIALQTSIALGAVTAVIREIPTDFDHVIEKWLLHAS